MIAPLALLALMAGAAAPQVTPVSVSVSTMGKSEAALHADLLSASQAVCRAEFQSPIDASEIDQCVAASYEAALWRAKRIRQSRQAPIRSAQLVR